MLKRDTIVFKSAEDFASKTDFGVHHIFFNINGYKAFFSGNTGDGISRDPAGAFYNHCSIVFRTVCVSDVNWNTGFSYREDCIFVEYGSTHVSELS